LKAYRAQIEDKYGNSEFKDKFFAVFRNHLVALTTRLRTIKQLVRLRCYAGWRAIFASQPSEATKGRKGANFQIDSATFETTLKVCKLTN